MKKLANNERIEERYWYLVHRKDPLPLPCRYHYLGDVKGRKEEKKRERKRNKYNRNWKEMRDTLIDVIWFWGIDFISLGWQYLIYQIIRGIYKMKREGGRGAEWRKVNIPFVCSFVCCSKA